MCTRGLESLVWSFTKLCMCYPLVILIALLFTGWPFFYVVHSVTNTANIPNFNYLGFSLYPVIVCISQISHPPPGKIKKLPYCIAGKFDEEFGSLAIKVETAKLMLTCNGFISYRML